MVASDGHGMWIQFWLIAALVGVAMVIGIVAWEVRRDRKRRAAQAAKNQGERR